MTSAERLVAVAAAEVGVKESPAGSNRVKYNTWFYGREVSGASYPWCAAFVCWCFAQAGMAELVRKTGGCTTMMNWYKAKGRIVPTRQARPGDVVFYQFDKDAYADHVGIVEKVTATGVVAIEGNTSVKSDDNGGAVMRRTRKWSLIMAVARPDHNSVKEEVEMTNAEVVKLVNDSVEKAVKPLDEALAKALQPALYDTVGECPKWSREAVQWAVDHGYIRGDEHGRLKLDDHKIWAIQKDYNMMVKSQS